jgi:uncharacterized membrane protein
MKKTLSFAAVHFTVAFTLGYLLTGSFVVGGLLALVEPAANTVAFHFHEKVWRRIEAKRSRSRGAADGHRCARPRSRLHFIRASASAA